VDIPVHLGRNPIRPYPLCCTVTCSCQVGGCLLATYAKPKPSAEGTTLVWAGGQRDRQARHWKGPDGSCPL
jgi:hypothetical protein